MRNAAGSRPYAGSCGAILSFAVMSRNGHMRAGFYDEPLPVVSTQNLTAAIAGRVAYIRGQALTDGNRKRPRLRWLGLDGKLPSNGSTETSLGDTGTPNRERPAVDRMTGGALSVFCVRSAALSGPVTDERDRAGQKPWTGELGKRWLGLSIGLDRTQSRPPVSSAETVRPAQGRRGIARQRLRAGAPAHHRGMAWLAARDRGQRDGSHAGHSSSVEAPGFQTGDAGSIPVARSSS